MVRLIGKICLLILGINAFLSSSEEDHCKQIFTSYWINKHWGNGASVSGSGSNLKQTDAIRKQIPQLLKQYKCKSFMDAPCGDFFWMQHVDLPVQDYIGIDVVEPLIQINQDKFGNHRLSFAALDITQDPLPLVDCILCRDCLTHFSKEDIFKTIANFKRSGSKYLLTTSFVDRKSNQAIETGEWQPLNLLEEPFFFPKPIAILNEQCSEDQSRWRDKSLLLWKLKDLELPED